jgi:hypothetical protein
MSMAEKSSTRKSPRTKAQHYVPQFYLRGFTDNEKIFCYDKLNDRVFETNTKSIAQQSNFYEIASSDQHTIPDNLIEKALSRMEAVWAPMVVNLIQSADAGKITCRQLLEFSPFVAMQWMRTNSYREMAYETITKYGQEMVNDIVKLNFPGQDCKLRFSLKKSCVNTLQAQHIFDSNLVEKMADELDRHIWVVGINNTENPFYTSDNPVVRRGNRMIGTRLGVGINDHGIEFMFPLDNRHILLIMEKNHFVEWKIHDNKSVLLTPEQIMDYNGLQVKRSHQRVYCVKDNFDLARSVCNAEPAIRNPNRPRVEVGSTELMPDGDQMRNSTYVVALE